MNKPVNPALHPSPAYDQMLQALGLVDAPGEQAFDNLTALAARVLGTPTAIINIVQPSEGRQYFKSHTGLPAVVAQKRQAPLNHSFCNYVRATSQPLAVPNAHEHPLAKYNGARADLGIIAYLGMPIHLPDNTPIGTLCVLDSSPRNWTEEDRQTLKQIALCVDEKIALKAMIADAENAENAAQEAVAARERFLAHMAHEIRTPLNGIIGSVDLMNEFLGDAPQDSDQAQLLRSIETSSMGLLRILNDSLDLSKIDAGELALESLPFSPQQATKEIMGLFRASAEAKSVSLTCDCSNDHDASLRLGDEFRFRQVLGNLVSNAVKFTDSGEVRLNLQTDTSGLTLTVSDTGVGMSDEQLARLFTPYSQATAATARLKGGTGLGLAIVKNLVDLMGGDISVDSTVGSGSQFKVHLPMPPTAAEDQERVSPDVLRNAFNGKAVLVADDSSVNRLVLKKMLESMGATVETASNGMQALQQAQDSRFDFLFVDIQMPDFSGEQIARALRADTSSRVAQGSAKLIAVTANVFPEQIQSYLDAGFDHCLGKPLKRLDLLDLLQQIQPQTCV